jgi:hypothetical protein
MTNKITIKNYPMIVKTLEESGFISFQQKSVNPSFILRNKQGKMIGKIDSSVLAYFDCENLSMDSISMNTNVLFLGNYRNNYRNETILCFVDSYYKKSIKDYLNIKE